MAGNCPQITVPLPLGMGLDADPRIVGEYLAIPVSGQNAELTPSASSADIGTTWPVALGIQLATSGASAYALQGDYLAIDVAEQSADLVLADPGSDIGITAPLTLGLLLGTTAYTLVGEHLLVPISFAPCEAYEEDAEAVAEERRSRRAGARTKLESDRRRLALQWWYDYLTKPQPSEQTKRVIAEVKAGRPIPQDAKPPKGPENISAKTLADRILPERRIEAENVLAHMVDMQKVVENALRIAQEKEEEELLMLL